MTRETSIVPQERCTYKQVNAIEFEKFKAAVTGCNAIVHLATQMRNVKDEEGNRTRSSAQYVRVSLALPQKTPLFTPLSYLTGGACCRITADARMSQDMHNNAVSMSFNALSIAEELGIKHVVVASSVNSIGISEFE